MIKKKEGKRKEGGGKESAPAGAAANHLSANKFKETLISTLSICLRDDSFTVKRAFDISNSSLSR